MCDERNVSPYLRRRLRTLAEALRDRERRRQRARSDCDEPEPRDRRGWGSAATRRSPPRSDGEGGEP